MREPRAETPVHPLSLMSTDIPSDHPLRDPNYVAGLVHGTALRLDAVVKRVEALEAAQQQLAAVRHITLTSTGSGYKPIPAGAGTTIGAPAGELVKRVTAAVNRTVICSQDGIALAAIREVAEWLDSNDTGILIGTAGNVAEMIRQEADLD